MRFERIETKEHVMLVKKSDKPDGKTPLVHHSSVMWFVEKDAPNWAFEQLNKAYRIANNLSRPKPKETFIVPEVELVEDNKYMMLVDRNRVKGETPLVYDNAVIAFAEKEITRNNPLPHLVPWKRKKLESFHNELITLSQRVHQTV